MNYPPRLLDTRRAAPDTALTRKVRPRRLSLRRATREQMPIAADILRSTAEWYRPFLSDDDMAEHHVDDNWGERNFDRRDFYLAWCGEHPVGVLSIQETGDVLYLGYVYLFEEKTGKGYGREMLDFARERARAMGKKSLVLICHPEASWAKRAYESFGFQCIAKSREEVLSWGNGWLEPYYEEGFQLYRCSVAASTSSAHMATRSSNHLPEEGTLNVVNA